MKIKLYKLTLFITALFIFGCTSSDEDIEMQTIQQNEIITAQPGPFDYFRTTHEVLNKKGGGKDPKPYWTAEYSNWLNEQGDIGASFLIPGTTLVYIYDYPNNGEDRIHVNGEYGHITWNIKEPYVWVVDISTGIMIYSNACEENRTGFFKETLSGLVFEEDRSGDGTIDVWQIRANHPESDANVHIKTTLTDAQSDHEPWNFDWYGGCVESSTEVNFVTHAKVKNGNFLFKVELAGEKYEWERILNP